MSTSSTRSSAGGCTRSALTGPGPRRRARCRPRRRSLVVRSRRLPPRRPTEILRKAPSRPRRFVLPPLLFASDCDTSEVLVVAASLEFAFQHLQREVDLSQVGASSLLERHDGDGGTRRGQERVTLALAVPPSNRSWSIELLRERVHAAAPPSHWISCSTKAGSSPFLAAKARNSPASSCVNAPPLAIPRVAYHSYVSRKNSFGTPRSWKATMTSASRSVFHAASSCAGIFGTSTPADSRNWPMGRFAKLSLVSCGSSAARWTRSFAYAAFCLASSLDQRSLSGALSFAMAFWFSVAAGCGAAGSALFAAAACFSVAALPDAPPVISFSFWA